MLSAGKFTICFLFLCINISLATKGFGQSSNTIIFTSWQKKDGLPSNTVQAIEKDNLGFLWIATIDGLCRYDGPNLIKVYRKSEDGAPESNSLKSNNIRSLYCDSKGFLWIGTRYGGLTRFHPSTNEWKTFQHDANQENTLSNDEVLCITEDSKQQIWVGTEKGLNLFDRSTSTFTRFKLFDTNNNEASNKAVLTIMEDQQGWIWVGTWSGGLYLLQTDEKGDFIQKQTRHFHTTTDKSSNNVWCLFQDNGGRYWLGTNGGGLLLMQLPKDASNQPENKSWQPTFHKYTPESKYALNLKSNFIRDIMQDKFNDLWFATIHGVYKISGNDLPNLNSPQQVPLNFEIFLKSYTNTNSIIGNAVCDLLEDEQGMIWLATDSGLNQYNWHSNQFKNYNFPQTDINSQYDPSFIVDKDNNIWIGYGKRGICKYRISDEKLIQIEQNINHLLLGKEVMTLYSPDRRWLYVGTELGVTSIDLKTLKSKKYPIPDWLRSNIQNLAITSFLIDRNDFIWVGTKVGILRINPKTKAFSLYEPKSHDPNSISDLSVNDIIQDDNGAIWIATYNGLNKITDPLKDKPIFEKFFFNAEQPEKGPMNNRVICLKEVNNYLYIGTKSGICRYNFHTEKFESFNSNNHKYSICSIEEGLNNNIWVSTSEGIFHFDSNKKIFRAFDKKDGLVNTTYSESESFKDDNGSMYFIHDRGVTFFSPKVLASNKVAPPVYITGIEKWSQNGTKLEDAIHKNLITLNHNDYRLSINYAALNYNRADKNQYAYRLIGLEDQWNEVKVGTPIVFTNLEPKEYKLEIKAANNDGIWNEQGVSINIIQYPPYWETWWFRLIALFVLISAAFATMSWYTNNIRKHNDALQAYNKNLNDEISQRKRVEQQLSDYNKELKRSNKELEQFAYVSSHDLKEPLRVIANFTSLLRTEYDEKLDNNALKYIDFIEGGIQRMLNVVDSLLTYSTVGKKSSIYHPIDLNLLLKNKIIDLSQLINERNAFVQIKKLPHIVGEKEQIGMVFFNLINNAIKFNNQKRPHIIVQVDSTDREFWKFSVKDNGIGIDKRYKDKVFGIFKRLHNKHDYEGTGIGLSVCQKIISRHKGDIWFESKPDKGTIFYFTIKKNLIAHQPTRLREAS